MSERAMAAEKPQSKMDDALLQLNERLESLGQAVTHLENRLRPVTNDYPRAMSDERENVPHEKPTGDSALLLKLYQHSADLNNQTERIQALMGRLDV